MSQAVDVIIPCFNQPEFTFTCLLSLKRTVPELIRVILVDNGSDEKSVGAFKDGLRGLDHVYLRMPENLGFVKATNAGLAVSTAHLVWLLNNDTEVPEKALPNMMEVLEKDPCVGIVGPRSSSHAQWQGQHPEGTGWEILPPSAMLSFFCALMRRQVIERCGYLSEAYRDGLGDDDDYCEVVKRDGWKLALRNDTVVTHHHRTTFRAVYGENGWLTSQKRNLEYFKSKWDK